MRLATCKLLPRPHVYPRPALTPRSGGSVLTQFLKSTTSDIKDLSVSVLVRKPEQADYFKAQGVNAILFNGLDQTDLLRKTASEHDIVVNTASAFEHQAAEALIQGLAERKRTSDSPVYYIHVGSTPEISERTRQF